MAERKLRIAHVVTLFSPDGAYGGPTRVAVNQARALTDRGHDVTIFGGVRGFEHVPETYDGVPVELFPVRRLIPGIGFAGLYSSRLIAHLARHARKYDVFHIHLARDLITLPAGLMSSMRGVPFVAQTHGMIDPTSHILAHALDQFLTRPILRSSAKILHLTPKEAVDLISVVRGREIALEILPNGVPSAPRVSLRNQGEPDDVLFLARLHERKRPKTFVEAAALLGTQFPDVTFSIVGPDEGEGPSVRELARTIDPSGSKIRLQGPMRPEDTIDRMREASVYVLPSANEPFPMSVLEAMSVGLPVIIRNDCGLSQAVRGANAGVIVDGSADSVARAIGGLLADRSLRQSLGDNARSLVEMTFSMEAVARRLEVIYRQVRAEASPHKTDSFL